MIHRIARSTVATRAGLRWCNLLCSLAAASCFVQHLAAQGVVSDSFSPYVDSKGGITLPKDF
jgi:hypothetical protein